MSSKGPASFLELDSEQLLAATAGLPGQLRTVLSAELPGLPAGAFAHVVVLGMGGSGVAGAVAQALSGERGKVPFVTVQGYDCPAFVGPGSLVFAVSFSGETEETLAAASAALAAGAAVVAVTGGGALAELTERGGGTVLRFPPGVPQPRAGLGYMVGLLLVACEELGLLPGCRADLEAAVAQLDKRLATLGDGGGVAAELARRVGRTIPLVHGASGLGEVAARRWKTQVNENAKAPAFSGAQPEVCHNELCGFGQLGDVTRQLLTLVELRLANDSPRIGRRFAAFGDLAGEAVGEVIEVRGEGDGPLAGFFDLVAIGDFVSLHLAAAEGVDPGPVPVLAEVKRRLKEA